jgi:hypothetical protein
MLGRAAYNGQDAAHIDLADISADSGEVIDCCWDLRSWMDMLVSVIEVERYLQLKLRELTS